MQKVQRIGVSLEDGLLEKFDKLISAQGYENRSEAIRDLIRHRLTEEELGNPKAEAVAGTQNARIAKAAARDRGGTGPSRWEAALPYSESRANQRIA